MQFDERMAELDVLLRDGPPETVDGLADWSASHRRHAEIYQSGDYEAAVAQAIGDAPDASAAQFEVVDSGLYSALEETRGHLRAEVASAGRRLAWSPTGTLLLMMIAGIATVIGLWPRLKEFL